MRFPLSAYSLLPALLALLTQLQLSAQVQTQPLLGSVRSAGNLTLSEAVLTANLQRQGSHPITAMGIVLAQDSSDLSVDDPQALTLTLPQANHPQAGTLYPFAFSLSTPASPQLRANTSYLARAYATANGTTVYGQIAYLSTGLAAPEGGTKLQTLNLNSTTAYDGYTSVTTNGDGSSILALRAKVRVGSNECYLEKSTDSGDTWTRLKTFTEIVGFDGIDPASHIAASDDQQVIGVIISSNALGYQSLGRAYLSRDSGSSWEELILPEPALNEPWGYDAMAISMDGHSIALSYFTKPQSGQDTRSGYRPGIAVAALPLNGSIVWESFDIGDSNSIEPKLNSMHMTADGSRILYSFAPTAPNTTTSIGLLARVSGAWARVSLSHLGARNWKSSFISPDGNTLLAASDTETLCSRDGGENWTTLPTAFSWRQPMHSSQDGSHLVWVNRSPGANQLQRSSDGGTHISTFPNQGSTFNWTSTACSHDGLIQLAAAYGNTESNGAGRGIYLLSSPNAALSVRNAAGQNLQDGASLDLGTLRRARPQDQNHLTLVLSNPSDNPVSDLGFRISGPNASHFTVSGLPANQVLPAHGLSILTLSFSNNGAAAGNKTAQLEISSGSPATHLSLQITAALRDGPQLAIKLSDAAASPELGLAEALDLEPGIKTLYLHNTGDQDLTLTSARLSHPLLTSDLSLPLTIEPQGSRAMPITLATNPSTSAAQNASLSFSTNDDPPTTNLSLRLTQAELEIWANNEKLLSDSHPLALPSWALGTEQIRRDFTLRNTGSAPLRDIQFTAQADGDIPAGALGWQAPVSSTLEAGQSSLAFATFGRAEPADSSEGLKGLKLIIQSNDPRQPSRLLRSRGTQLRPSREISLRGHNQTELSRGTRLDFGAVIAAHPTGVNRLIHLQNLGNTALASLRLSLAGTNSADFTIVQGIPAANTRAGLDAAASLPILLRFKPTGTNLGNRAATLTVACNDSDEPSTVINLAGSLVSASQAADLLILGDGTSDVGQGFGLLNAVPISPSWPLAPASRGRSTHGALWADFLNAPSLAYGSGQGSGRNLAVNLARINSHPQQTGDLATASLSFSAQADLLIGKVRGADGSGRFSSAQHLCIWVGQSDLLDLLNQAARADYPTSITSLKTALAAKITNFSNLGASRILLINQPYLTTPIEDGYTRRQNLEYLTRLWNEALAELVVENQSSTLLIDLCAAHEAILAQTTSLGFTEADQEGTLNALRSDQRLFWSETAPTRPAIASRRLHSLWATQMGVFASATPEILVRQGTTNLSSAVSVLTINTPIQVQVVNTGTSPLNALAWCLLDRDAAHFDAQEHDGSKPALWENGYLPAPTGKARESQPAHLKLAYNSEATGALQPGLHLAVLRITSSDRDEGYHDITLQRTIAPAGQTLALGSPLALAIRSHDGHRYQWKKNGVNLPGEQSPELYIARTQFGDAGTYSVEITLPNLQRVLISGIEVVIIDQNSANPLVTGTASGRSLSLSAQFAASSNLRSSLRFQWYQDQSALIGAISSSLRIASMSQATTGLYRCDISTPEAAGGLTISSSYHQVNLITSAPTSIAQIPLPPEAAVARNDQGLKLISQAATPLLFEGTVGKWIEQPTSPLVAGTVTAYSAGGLPPGLSINKATGLITGYPNKAGSYSLKLSFTNPSGSLSLQREARITALPVMTDAGIALAGASYSGIIPRHSLNRQAGGRLDLTLTSKGLLSGKITFGTEKARSFSGGLDATEIWQSRRLILPAAADAPPLTIELIFSANGCSCTLTRPQAANSPTLSTLLLAQARSDQITSGRWLGNYSMALEPSNTRYTEAPSGSGWLKLSINQSGLGQIAGRTPDGMSVTLSTSISSSGAFGLFLANAAGQNLQSEGFLRLNHPDASPQPHRATKLTGAASYGRSPSARASNYPNGFEPQSISVYGGAEITPTSSAPPLTYIGALDYKQPEPLPLPEIWTKPDFWLALEAAEQPSRPLFWWDSKGMGTCLSGLTEANGRPMFSIKPAGAEVSGKVTLTQRGVIGADAKNGLVREVVFSGIVVRRASPQAGGIDELTPLGHCLVRRRPTSILQVPNQMPQISLPWTFSRY